MADFAAARLNMVESQVRTADVTDLRIQDAMHVLPRERFMPQARAFQAYADLEVEYAPGRWLLKPRDVGKLIQALRPLPGETALAISAPYAAAVLEALGVTVTQVDAAGELPEGPFDIIVCEGAVARAPAAWTALLAANGRLGVVERSGPVGKASLYVKADGGVGHRELFDAFPPLLAGFEPQHGFAF
jgi:protein-L-isoaspartate(D-aspartate) O-methyltransferase